MNKSIPVSDREMAVLDVLVAHYHDYDGGHCLYFRYVAEETGLEIKQVRRACRALARKGLAQYVRGLFDDDGMVAGSGYCCTRAGRDVFAERSSAQAQTAMPAPD